MAERNVFWYLERTEESRGIKVPVVKITVGEKLEFSEGTERQVGEAKELVALHCLPPMRPGDFIQPVFGEAFDPHKIRHWELVSLEGECFTSQELLELFENDYEEYARRREEYAEENMEAIHSFDWDDWDEENLGGWKQVWQNFPREEREMFLSILEELPWGATEERVNKIKELFS